MKHILHSYQNGNTVVTLYSDGTKTRQYEGLAVPCFPENMDVKITDYCDAGCHWCHEKSTQRGQHGNLDHTIEVLKSLPPGIELAIGGGNPFSHPQLVYFLEQVKDIGLIANITINEFHYSKNLDLIRSLIERKLLYGVGYSYNKIVPEVLDDNMVVHVIIGVTPVSHLDALIKGGVTKILLLGYKEFGRGINHYNKNESLVKQNINEWFRYLPHVISRAHFSFDNLAISQLKPYRLFKDPQDYNEIYMGHEGEFSMYLDAVKEQYAVCSFAEKRLPYTNSIEEMFSTTRKIALEA